MTLARFFQTRRLCSEPFYCRELASPFPPFAPARTLGCHRRVDHEMDLVSRSRTSKYRDHVIAREKETRLIFPPRPPFEDRSILSRHLSRIIQRRRERERERERKREHNVCPHRREVSFFSPSFVLALLGELRKSRHGNCTASKFFVLSINKPCPPSLSLSLSLSVRRRAKNEKNVDRQIDERTDGHGGGKAGRTEGGSDEGERARKRRRTGCLFIDGAKPPVREW